MTGKQSTGRSRLLASTMMAVAAVVVLPVSVFAQEQGGAIMQGSDASPAAGAKAEGGLQDIVVTARKRSERTQDVPVAITALTGEQLKRADLTSIEKISASSPEITVGRSAVGSGAQLVMRGIGSNSSSVGIEQSIAVIVDGVYYGQGRIINEGFFDLERAELLKGPQALFFGKNATAGVISLTTKGPSAEREFSARTAYEFGSRNLIGEVIGSGPLSDTLGIRVALHGSDMFGGYFTNEAPMGSYRTTNQATGVATTRLATPGDRYAPQTKEFVGRVTLNWQPDDRFKASLKLSANVNENNSPAWNFVPFNCPTGASARNASLACGKDFRIYQNNLPAGIGGVTQYGKDGDIGVVYKSWQATGSAEYSSDTFTISSVNNYNWNRNHYVCDCDFTSSNVINSAFSGEVTEFKALSTENRIQTKFDGMFNAMFGVYYQHSRRQYASAAVGGGFDNPNAPDPSYRFLTNSKNSETKGDTFAFFGQATLRLLPQVELAAGARYTLETKDSFFEHPYANPSAVTFLPNVRINAHQKFDNWSPEATLTYKPSRNLTIYGGYKTAYKSGGFSNSGILSPLATVDDFTFDPETVRGFEGGVKSTLFDRQLQANVALYTYLYKNLQIDFFNAPVFAFSTINAGAARTKGVELSLEFAPRGVPGLMLRGSVNYNHARYQNFADAPCYTGQTPAAGCTTLVPRATQNLSGVPTAMAPAWTGAFGGDYDFDLSSDWRFGLSANARYSDNYLSSSFGNPASRQGSYVVVDASMRLQTQEGRYEIALIGKNLTNRFYVTGEYDGPLTGSGTGTAGGVVADQIGFAALPRTVQLQLTAKF